ADANLAHIDKHIASIHQPVDVIVLPEMFATGFSMRAETLAKGSSTKALEQMKRWAKEKSCVVCGSLMFEEAGKYYNRMIWMKPDGNYVHYDKRHLFSLGEEHNHYGAGSKRLTVECKGWKIRLIVCYDLRFPVWCRNNDDYDLMIVVANWPERRAFAWNQLLIARAIENQCYVAAVNRVGEDGNKIYHSGDSAVLDYKGETLTKASHDEVVLYQTLQREPLQDFRKHFPFLAGRDSFTLHP
ncbi:MAG TPA: amidohydrolase, partial [Chitinophagales bacterium]|nr:amidohydrolase [Chitinophagales bacterium]